MRKLLLVLSLLLVAADARAGCNETMLSITDWSVRTATDTDVEVSIRVQSTAGKPIRMLKAIAYFNDALGEPIGAIPVGPDVNIAAGGEYSESRNWFAGVHFARLLKLRKQDVKTATCVKAVLYEDGSQETF